MKLIYVFFFNENDWAEFNSKTLTENRLNHFIRDSIDFFNRESFFNYMKKSDFENEYSDFYLIEIEDLSMEEKQSKKIIILNNHDQITKIAFSKTTKWNKIELSNDEEKKFNYNSLNNNSLNTIDQVYTIITHVIGNSY